MELLFDQISIRLNDEQLTCGQITRDGPQQLEGLGVAEDGQTEVCLEI